MYNRYIRNDKGVYTRVPQAEPSTTADLSHSSTESASAPPVLSHETGPRNTHQKEPPSVNPHLPLSGKTEQISDSLSSFLRHVLNQLRLDQVDTGDLLLLGLLFFLFREDADEELLVALGLLLIL